MATPTAALIFAIWLTIQLKNGDPFSTVVEEGAIILSGLLAATLLAALLFAVTLYTFFGSLAMLAIIIRKLEAATRPERDRVIEQQKETIEKLRNQVRRSGQEPEA